MRPRGSSMSAATVLLHAPTGRDGALVSDVLTRAGHLVAGEDSMEALCARIGDDGAVAIIAEEALTPPSTRRLIAALSAQPSWSDFPVVVLTSVLAMQRPAQSLFRTLRERGNVTLLERPVHPMTLLSAVEVAIRARRRQYEVRDYLEARERAEEHTRQVQKMEAVGQLAGGVAHEVNNMMTVVLGFGEFVLGRLRRAESRGTAIDPAALRSEVEEMVKAGKRSAAITQQLLAFSRRQRHQAVRLRLQEIVPELRELLRRLVGASIEVSIRLPDDLPVVRVDRTQIEQVLINLVINARDAMDGPGSISITGECVELGTDFMARHRVADVQRGRWVQLAVSDTGRGMDRETQERAFEPFFTTKPVGAGTGLGLSTAYGIIKQSGGYIWLYSEPAIGTTVKVYLPECDGETSRSEAAAPAEAASGETILVVEDEPVVRRLARMALEEVGYAVIEAADGGEALEALRRADGTVQLVLSDVVMPGMGGQELAQVLRADRPELPLLFMSGYQGEDVTDRGLLEPGAAFIQKPFAPEELTRRVRALLDERRVSP
ncbi:MAG TPA: response regulator [Gemmatimonadales bacterium]|nr:response regulator [Gemmatimonadales bacterium]